MLAPKHYVRFYLNHFDVAFDHYTIETKKSQKDHCKINTFLSFFLIEKEKLLQKSPIFARMKETSIQIPLLIKQEDELTAVEMKLLNEACLATYRSYAPYSHFSVGAAVELADGTIVSGSNQENAAYPSGLCAERTAVFYAQSRYPNMSIRRLCITARDTEGHPLQRPIAPCGACRQVLLEAEQRAGQPIEILLHGTTGTYVIRSVQDLLPLSFDNSFL